MSHPLAPAAETAGLRIPYLLATPTQQALALTYLRQRLTFLFPTLQDHTWQQSLIALQPNLRVAGPQVALAEADLRQLVHHLAASPELPLPAPSLVDPDMPSLADYKLRTRELVAWVLHELVASSASYGPGLYALLGHLIQPDLLTQQVVPSPVDKPTGLPQPPAPAMLQQTVLFPSDALQNAPELLDRRTQRDYSEHFKLAVVWEVGCGQRTPSQARLHYGVQGSSTVLEWCRKYAAHFQAAQLTRAADSAPATMVKPALHPTLKQQLQQLKQQLRAPNHLSADEVKDRQDLNLLLRTLQ